MGTFDSVNTTEWDIVQNTSAENAIDRAFTRHVARRGSGRGRYWHLQRNEYESRLEYNEVVGVLPSQDGMDVDSAESDDDELNDDELDRWRSVKGAEDTSSTPRADEVA